MDAIAIPGGRDVRATIDGDEAADAVVVACPPHPQHGGSRTDQRLRAVSDALVDRDIACLRFDYGPWDDGRGERADAENALGWARDRFGAAGLFGYSFGAGVALRAAANADHVPAAVSVLAPPSDAVDAVDALGCPLQVVAGERDTTVDSGPVVTLARDRGATVESLPADHHFVGQSDRVGGLAAAFFADLL
jgi:alpha/beta superfamily hydrolase